MKVTKFIREYVTEEVTRIYRAKKNPFEEEYNATNDLIANFKEAINKEMRERVQEFVSENKFTNYKGEPFVVPGEVFTLGYNRMVFPAAQKYADWDRDNEKAKQDKIREILISLELGATKSELTDMIAALTVEG